MFDVETIAFLRDLRDSNDRDWFAANRSRYQAHWKAPAEAFCDAMSAELTRRVGAPVEAKLYRIHRDVRFARDKTPYNAHVHAAFHTGGGRGEGWMLGLDAESLTLGYGVFRFAPAQLDPWRQAVDGPAGSALAGLLDAGVAAGLRLDPPALKRVPAPYPRDHPRGDLLRRKGIVLWRDGLPPEAAFGAAAVTRLARDFAVFEPLRRWLTQNLAA